MLRSQLDINPGMKSLRYICFRHSRVVHQNRNWDATSIFGAYKFVFNAIRRQFGRLIAAVIFAVTDVISTDTSVAVTFKLIGSTDRRNFHASTSMQLTSMIRTIIKFLNGGNFPILNSRIWRPTLALEIALLDPADAVEVTSQPKVGIRSYLGATAESSKEDKSQNWEVLNH